MFGDNKIFHVDDSCEEVFNQIRNETGKELSKEMKYMFRLGFFACERQFWRYQTDQNVARSKRAMDKFIASENQDEG